MARKRRAAQRRRSNTRSSSRSLGLTRLPGFWVVGIGAIFLILGIAIFMADQQRATGAPLPSIEELTIEDDVVKGDLTIGRHEMGASVAPTAPIPPEGPPKLVLAEHFYDFGTIPATNPVEHTFPVRNEGKGTLTISRVYTTCGCTTAELSSRVIPPGKVATLKVVYDPAFHDVTGEVRRSVILEHNDPESQGNTMIDVIANVES